MTEEEDHFLQKNIVCQDHDISIITDNNTNIQVKTQSDSMTDAKIETSNIENIVDAPMELETPPTGVSPLPETTSGDNKLFPTGIAFRKFFQYVLSLL